MNLVNCSSLHILESLPLSRAIWRVFGALFLWLIDFFWGVSLIRQVGITRRNNGLFTKELFFGCCHGVHLGCLHMHVWCGKHVELWDVLFAGDLKIGRKSSVSSVCRDEAGNTTFKCRLNWFSSFLIFELFPFHCTENNRIFFFFFFFFFGWLRVFATVKADVEKVRGTI